MCKTFSECTKTIEKCVTQTSTSKSAKRYQSVKTSYSIRGKGYFQQPHALKFPMGQLTEPGTPKKEKDYSKKQIQALPGNDWNSSSRQQNGKKKATTIVFTRDASVEMSDQGKLRIWLRLHLIKNNTYLRLLRDPRVSEIRNVIKMRIDMHRWNGTF